MTRLLQPVPGPKIQEEEQATGGWNKHPPARLQLAEWQPASELGQDLDKGEKCGEHSAQQAEAAQLAPLAKTCLKTLDLLQEIGRRN
jgi:hypothetical protein